MDRPITRPMILLRGVSFAMLLVMVVMSLYPNLTLPEPALTRGFTDKLYHVGGFFILVILAGSTLRTLLGFALAMVALAVVMELSQVLAAGRGVFLSDLIANLIGVALGLGLLLAARAWRRQARDLP